MSKFNCEAHDCCKKCCCCKCCSNCCMRNYKNDFGKALKEILNKLNK